METQEKHLDQLNQEPDVADKVKGYRPEIVVKFPDEVRLPLGETHQDDDDEDYSREVGEYVRKAGLVDLDELEERYGDVTTQARFSGFDPDVLERIVEKTEESDPAYKPVVFSSYLSIEFPPDTDGGTLGEARRFLEDESQVELTFFGGRPGPPPSVNPHDDPFFQFQGFLTKEKGIGAELVWDDPGVSGEGIRIVDVEQGWNLDHPDLPPDIPILWGADKAYRGHGTAALGIVVAVDNQIGNIGIAPGASASVVSEWRKKSSSKRQTHKSIIKILERKKDHGEFFAGDVILLEAQHFPPGNAAPLPIEQAEHDVLKAIQTAVLNHRLVVVEAAGNGAQDIGAGEEDSGAIIVGAATSGAPHFWLGSSNYGERVDCYAWGEAINTLWSDNSGKTNTKSFGKTSGAVAIIAGAAVLVQSAAKVKRGAPLEPRELRDMFREIGTASGDADEFPIGVMPDLEKIIAAL